jgi:hypothetical protein
MYGVVKSVDRSLEIMDGTHEIPNHDIWSASFRLYQPMNFWPEGTIFVSVVDPGVGTARKGCVAQTSNGYFIVTPDNGSLTHVKAWIGIDDVREIDENVNRLKGKNTEETSVFHGRDVFAYCAARLASGQIGFAGVGPAYPVDEIITLPILEPVMEAEGRLRGIIEINDPNFGNLWTNIPQPLFTEAGFSYGEDVQVTVWHDGTVVFQETIPHERSFGFVPKGAPVIYTNELMRISLAVCEGRFSEKYGLGYGSDWEIEFQKV